MARDRTKELLKLIPVGERLKDPFDVVPIVADDTTAKPRAGGLVIRREVAQKPGPQRWFTKWFKYDQAVYLKLDEHGAFFWEQINGSSTLATITKAMAARFTWPDDACRESVVLFVKELMVRHFIYLSIPRKGSGQ